MRVTPVAWTEVVPILPEALRGTPFAARFRADIYADFPHDVESDADLLAEMTGRGCYEAWEVKNPETAQNKGYLANIIDHGHFSVLEHASVTFYVEGVSRSLLAELTRHRHLSFSVRSQRYVDESNAEMVVPPTLEAHMEDETSLRDQDGDAVTIEQIFRGSTYDALTAYAALVDALVNQGLPRKQAREAARSVLPNATSTNLFVTGNHRAWREVLAKRNSPHADREIAAFAREILDHLKDIAPNTYQDME